MATVVITVTLEGGSQVQAVVRGKSSYPDALGSMKREAIDAIQQTLDHFVGEGVEDVCSALEAGLAEGEG